MIIHKGGLPVIVGNLKGVGMLAGDVFDLDLISCFEIIAAFVIKLHYIGWKKVMGFFGWGAFDCMLFALQVRIGDIVGLSAKFWGDATQPRTPK